MGQAKRQNNQVLNNSSFGLGPLSLCCNAPLDEMVDLLDATLYAVCSKCRRVLRPVPGTMSPVKTEGLMPHRSRKALTGL